MHPASPRLEDLLAQVWALPGMRGGLRRLTPGRVRKARELLAQVGASGELAAVRGVFPLALARNERIASAARAAVLELLQPVRPAELARLDRAMRARGLGRGEVHRAWLALSTRDFYALVAQGRPDSRLLGVLSTHPDGHLREAVVIELARRLDGRELPWLLLRLADRVTPVRAAARVAVAARLGDAYVPHLLPCLPLVSRLAELAGGAPPGLVDRVAELLRRPQHAAELARAVGSKDRDGARLAIGVATACDAPDPRVVERGLAAADPLVRTRAARAAKRVWRGADLGLRVARLAADPSMRVRREALEVCLDRASVPPAEAEVLLRRALLDAHPTIRRLARFHLRRRAPEDFAAYYKEVLRGSGTSLEMALHGLGETGARADAAVVAPFAASPSSARVRRAAVRAVAALDPDAHLELFLARLADESGRVSREARVALVGRARRVAEERILELAASAPRRHVRRNAVRLCEELPKWRRIAPLVRATADPDDWVAASAQWHVRSWLTRYNRVTAEPSAVELAELAAALELPNLRLEPAELEELRAVIASFARGRGRRPG